MEKRTDLALEVRESFPEDDVEVSGVILEEETYLDGRIRKSTVEIKNVTARTKKIMELAGLGSIALIKENEDEKDQ